MLLKWWINCTENYCFEELTCSKKYLSALWLTRYYIFCLSNQIVYYNKIKEIPISIMPFRADFSYFAWRDVSCCSAGNGSSCCPMKFWTPCTAFLSMLARTTTVCRSTRPLPSTPTTSPTSALSDASLPWWAYRQLILYFICWQTLCGPFQVIK